MGRTGGGNGSPPTAPSTPPARGGNGAASTQQQQQQLQLQQHAVSGRARHAMVALPIALATFALVLQVWIQSMLSAHAGAFGLNRQRAAVFGQRMLLWSRSMRAMETSAETVTCFRAVFHARRGAAPADAARFRWLGQQVPQTWKDLDVSGFTALCTSRPCCPDE